MILVKQKTPGFVLEHPEMTSSSHYLAILIRGVFRIILSIYRFFWKTVNSF